MAKLNFCPRTAELRVMMGDGRHEEARKQAIELLRDGYAARPFLAFVAELLDPPKRGKGAPARPPQRWIEIGEAYQSLRDEGKSHQSAVGDLSDHFCDGDITISERTIERAVAMYRKAKDAE